MLVQKAGGGDGARKMNALVLTPEAPYPIRGGGPVRTASLLEYLRRQYALDLLIFREPGAPDPAAAVPGGLARNISVIDLPHHSRSRAARGWRNLHRFFRGAPPLIDRFSGFEAAIARALQGTRYDLGLVEHFWCAAYGPLLARHCSRVLLDLHNVESVLLERCAAAEPGAARILFRRFARACRRLERDSIPGYSAVLLASDTDAAALARIAPCVRSIVYPNTIPAAPRPRPASTESIVFSGNLGYHPNQTAIRWFAGEIWPKIRERHPGLVWRLVGRNSETVRDALGGDSRIHLIGPVDNALEVLAASRAAVVPLLSGSGTRVKILEAWAAGVPVVTTAIGAEGLPIEHETHALVADAPAAFAAAVSRVLLQPELAQRLSMCGRSLYETHFTWPAAWSRLEAAGL